MLPLSVAHILLAAIVALSILMMLIRPRGIAEVYWISGGAVLLAALRRCTWSSKSGSCMDERLAPQQFSSAQPGCPIDFGVKGTVFIDVASVEQSAGFERVHGNNSHGNGGTECG
jgi:hypothetical protein